MLVYVFHFGAKCSYFFISRGKKISGTAKIELAFSFPLASRYCINFITLEKL